MTNSIFTIRPYRYNSMWVFDDENVGLHREPFVAGIDVILSELTKNIKNANNGFCLVFSSGKFPGANIEMTKIESEFSGTWYTCENLGIKGWLCPALFKYFKQAPEKIWVQVSELT